MFRGVRMDGRREGKERNTEQSTHQELSSVDLTNASAASLYLRCDSSVHACRAGCGNRRLKAGRGQ
jgi:hypothetical protein